MKQRGCPLVPFAVCMYNANPVGVSEWPTQQDEREGRWEQRFVRWGASCWL
jgi:hypothetical protein